MATIVVAYVDKPEGRAALRRAADEAVAAVSVGSVTPSNPEAPGTSRTQVSAGPDAPGTPEASGAPVAPEASGAPGSSDGAAGAAASGSGVPGSGDLLGTRVVVIDAGPIDAGATTDTAARSAAGAAAGTEGAERRSDGLGQIIAELGDAGVDCEVRTLVPGDDLADDVLGTAEALTADLIVIGLRRRSPVGKLMLGTNAQRILLDASCPVLTVKAADPAATNPSTSDG